MRATCRALTKEPQLPHTLVLNASYEPLCVVPQRRAVVLVLNHKAVTLEGTGASLHAAGTRGVGWDLPAPSVVKLTRYVRVPLRRGVPLTRRAIFARDGGRCVYCDAPATSVDHVIPRSRGGQHAWDNVVSSCRRCNHVKADRPLPELGWRMKRPPVQPNGSAWRILSSGRTDQRWLPYLRGYGVDLELLPFEPQGPDGLRVSGVLPGSAATAVATVAEAPPAPLGLPVATAAVTPLAA